jgi:hypothetical protein
MVITINADVIATSEGRARVCRAVIRIIAVDWVVIAASPSRARIDRASVRVIAVDRAKAAARGGVARVSGAGRAVKTGDVRVETHTSLAIVYIT